MANTESIFDDEIERIRRLFDVSDHYNIKGKFKKMMEEHEKKFVFTDSSIKPESESELELFKELGDLRKILESFRTSRFLVTLEEIQETLAKNVLEPSQQTKIHEMIEKIIKVELKERELISYKASSIKRTLEQLKYILESMQDGKIHGILTKIKEAIPSSHFDILKKGVKIWNKWRENNPDIKPDLSGAFLNGASLKKANLRGAFLRKVNLAEADLRGADITGAILYTIVRDNWKIEGIKCDYVYFGCDDEERTPQDRNFRPGEFEELYRWRPLNEFERLIERSIEFPLEYKQAGVSILNYFSEILRKKYPESKATVQIKQDGLKVTMIVDPANGERQTFEEELNQFGRVVTGKITPEEYTDNPFQLIELKNELRSAYNKVELQKKMIQYQEMELNKRNIQIEKKNIQIERFLNILEKGMIIPDVKVINTVIGRDAKDSGVMSGDDNKINSIRNHKKQCDS